MDDYIPNYSESYDNCDTYRGGMHSALCSKLQRLEAERDKLYALCEADDAREIKTRAELDKYKSTLEDLEMIDRRIFRRLKKGESAVDLWLHRDRILNESGVSITLIRSEE